MSQESKYSVVLLDKSDCEIAVRPAESREEAKAEMRYLLSDDYAKAAETTHEAMGTYKAEARDASGQCVLDDFYVPNPQQAARKLKGESCGM